MRSVRFVILFTLIYFTGISLPAQSFSLGQNLIIQTVQVMPENYTTIILQKEIDTEPFFNRFDKSNPYTYLQLIHDINGRDSHILYQTNFLGSILFLAYSNNLSVYFNGRDKPLNVFVNCIRQSNEHISAVQNATAAISCIMQRLEFCSGN